MSYWLLKLSRLLVKCELNFGSWRIWISLKNGLAIIQKLMLTTRSHPMYFPEQLLILVPTGISMRFSQSLGNSNWGLTIKGCRLISVTKQTLRKEKACEKGERISKRQQFYLHFINSTKTAGLEKISPVSLFQVIKLSVRSLQEAWALATNFLKVQF